MYRELTAHGLIVREYRGEQVAATREGLAAEARVLRFARAGRNACPPLVSVGNPVNARLSDPERAAVRPVLMSTDRVVLVRGGAGGGTTTLVRECVRAIRGAGREVLLLAPAANTW